MTPQTLPSVEHGASGSSRRGEMADALALGASGRNPMSVRLRPTAPGISINLIGGLSREAPCACTGFKSSPRHHMHQKIIQTIGWYGVAAVVAAYILLSFRIVAPENIWYQLLNLTGALAIIVEASTKKDRQPVVLNIIWAVVALVALLRVALG